MKYNLFNNKKISSMTLGTVQLGMDYGIANTSGKPKESETTEILDNSLKLGITAFDTAAHYGNSEDILGNYFSKRADRDSVCMISKLKVGLPNTASDYEVEKAMYTSLENSLRRLDIPKLDCMLLHSAEDMTTYGDIVPKTLENFIKKGYIDKAGVSVYTSDEIDTMLLYEVYQAIQLPMNIFDQQLIHRGYLDKLNDKGIYVFVRSVFLQGLFFLEPDSLQDAQLIEYAKPYLLALRELCALENKTIAEFAISYIRDLPGVGSLVLGADTPKQVEENVSYMNTSPISDETRKKAKDIFEAVNIDKIMEILRKPKKRR